MGNTIQDVQTVTFSIPRKLHRELKIITVYNPQKKLRDLIVETLQNGIEKTTSKYKSNNKTGTHN